MKTHPTLTVTAAVVLGNLWLGGAWAICAENPKPAAPAPAPAAPPATPPAAAPKAPPVNGEALNTLRTAREKLTAPGVRSIKARIIERIGIGDRKFRLEGTYVQGTDLRLKLELKVIPDSSEETLEGAFLEVCDGTILWARHQIGSQLRVTRRDVRQILNASKSAGTGNLLALELGLGGLPALLASLERSMNFTTLSQEKVNGKNFTVIGGTWNDATLQTFKATTGNRPNSHIPDGVRIYLEPGILFPRRIDFLKKPKDAEETEIIAELDFLDIVINSPLDDHQFEFELPNGVRTIDVTNEYLRQLKGAPAK